jgi:hypothetical protein
MPAWSAKRCFRPEYIVARSSPAGLPARTGPGRSGDRQGVLPAIYTDVIRIYDHDCPPLPYGTHTPRPRANGTLIGPEQSGMHLRAVTEPGRRVDDLDSAVLDEGAGDFRPAN